MRLSYFVVRTPAAFCGLIFLFSDRESSQHFLLLMQTNKNIDKSILQLHLLNVCTEIYAIILVQI